MSFIYPDLRDRERTCIKKKVKSRSKYTCSEISHDPVEMTGKTRPDWEKRVFILNFFPGEKWYEFFFILTYGIGREPVLRKK